LDEPNIVYLPTAAGESLAYSCVGDGPPPIIPPSGLWSTFEHWNSRLAERHRVVCWDLRGSGGRPLATEHLFEPLITFLLAILLGDQ
jgi:pimeloyl-ACP methyl ester carboxylesterase